MRISPPSVTALLNRATVPSRCPPTKRPNLNAKITGILEEYAKYLQEVEAHRFRVRAYQNAVETLQAHHAEINSGAEARLLPGIGKSIGERVDEIIKTGSLKVLDNERKTVLAELRRVSGISQERAEELYEKDIRNIDDLKHSGELEKHQQIVCEEPEEFSQIVPTAEVKKIEEGMQEVAKGFDKSLKVHLVGPSSRRETVTGRGDLEFLLVHPDFRDETVPTWSGYLNPVIQEFQQKLKDEGRTIQNVDPVEENKFFTILRENESGIRRMITLTACTWENHPLALICLKRHPNVVARVMVEARLRCCKVKLNTSGYSRYELVKKSDGLKVSLKCEKEAFDFLGMYT